MYSLVLSYFFEGGRGYSKNIEQPIKYENRFLYVICISLVLLIGSFSTLAPSVAKVFNTSAFVENEKDRYAKLGNAEVLKYCPSGSKVLVWGWSSELFAYFDWYPPSDVVNDVVRLKHTTPSKGTMERIQRAIMDQDTDCIFEATGQNYFGSFASEEGLQSFTDVPFEALSLRYFQQLLENDVSVWVRRK
jgi:hypothetical protein